MDKALLWARRIVDFFYKLLFRYSEVVLLVIVLMVSVQVVLRKVFRTGFIWIEEVSLLLVVWMSFIALAIGVAEDLHISIGLFFDAFPKKVRKAIGVVDQLLVMAVGVMLAYYGARLISFTTNSTLPATKWPTFVLYLMIPVSGAYIVYFTILKLCRTLREGQPGDELEKRS